MDMLGLPLKTVLFVMLNPSIADEVHDDPTQRRCRGYAEKWGYGGYMVGNLFSYVSTDPKTLVKTSDPIGEENDHYLRLLHMENDLTIVAWGTMGRLRDRGIKVTWMLQEIKPVAYLGLTKDGAPRHPLYLRGSAKPISQEAGRC